MVTGDRMPEGYNTDLIKDLLFTQAELDMIYFTCLHDIGHPQAQEYALGDEGYETLLDALKKIQEFFDGIAEPDVVKPL